MHYIEFIPPVTGIDGVFNTVRLGGFYSKNLKAGDLVYLTDSKKKIILGIAEVVSVEYMVLSLVCELHGHRNHTQIGLPKSQVDLFSVIQKIYGPHIAQPNKKATVIYLKRRSDVEKKSITSD